MGVAPAVKLYKLLGIAGGGDAGVAEQLDARRSGSVGIGDLDPPALSAGRGVADHNVAAHLDHGAPNPVLFQHALPFVAGVSFGDAAQIEAHPLRQKLRRALAGIEAHHPPADTGARLLPLLRRRELTGSPGFAPQGDHRSYGRVERALAALRNLQGALQDAVEIVADLHRRTARLRAQLHQFAGRAIVAHDLFQFRHALEGGGAGAFRLRLVPRIDDDSGLHAHDELGILKFRQLCLRRPGVQSPPDQHGKA